MPEYTYFEYFSGFQVKSFFFFFNLFNIYLFLRDRAQVGKGQRERGTQNLKQALDSKLTVSTEPNAGLELTNHEIIT